MVCKQIDITNNNQLFECHDCLCLYHQECHKPPITKKDINDPRLVWYCSKCSKNIKKVGKRPATNNSSKLTVTKTPSSSLNLTSSINSGTPSTSPYPTNYQSTLLKDSNLVKPQSNYLKISETENKLQPGFKRAPTKFGSFVQSYSTNSKSSMQMSSTNRPSASIASSTNKGKTVSSSSSNNQTSALLSVNTLPNLDKRFPNLKKTKLAKYNN